MAGEIAVEDFDDLKNEVMALKEALKGLKGDVGHVNFNTDSIESMLVSPSNYSIP